jgi:hypothetical protein
MIANPNLRHCEARSDDAILNQAIGLAMADGASPKWANGRAFAIFNAGTGLIRRCAPRNNDVSA